MLTYGQLIARLRLLVWPLGEAPRLVPNHNQSFLECLIDLQTWVDCLKQNHWNSYPHCSTFYNCGLTSFEAPRGIIKGLRVYDKIASGSSGDVVASKFGNLVTASGDFFTANMVGSKIRFQDGEFLITGWIDPVRIIVFDPQITAAAPSGNQPYLYLSAKFRVNQITGFAESFNSDDGKWHPIEIVGGPGEIQLGTDQTGTT